MTPPDINDADMSPGDDARPADHLQTTGDLVGDSTPDVESTLTWAWLTEADLNDLAELREATDYLDDPVERVDLASLRDLFDAPDAHPSRNGAVGRDSQGSAIAYAWGHPREGEGEWRYWVDWAVHPAWRYRNIGHECAEWLVQRGLDWWQERRDEGSTAPLWMGSYVDEKLGLRVANLTHAGFVAEKWFTDMKVLFAQADPHQLPEVSVPGLRIVPFEQRWSEAVRVAHNEAFSTVRGSGAVSESVWEHILGATTVRPDWSWVALSEAEEVVGYAISSGYAPEWDAQGYTEGWTEFLGTVPSWRGRGVARAVLTRALQGFADAGLAGAGLGVDEDEQAPAHRLFTDLGYQPTERLVLMGMRRG